MNPGFAPWRQLRLGRPGSLAEGVAGTMGVMLALDQPGADRGRRQAQHVRSGDQAWAGALASPLSCDPTCAGRSLSRLARPVLAGRLRLTGAVLAAAGLALRRRRPQDRAATCPPRVAPDLAAVRR
jgi:hypothetical protein